MQEDATSVHKKKKKIVQLDEILLKNTFFIKNASPFRKTNPFRLALFTQTRLFREIKWTNKPKGIHETFSFKKKFM